MESIETFQLETVDKPWCQCHSTKFHCSLYIASHISQLIKLLQCVLMFQSYLEMQIKIGPLMKAICSQGKRF